MEGKIQNLIDTLTLKECLAVLAVCAPDVLEAVGDDLMNDKDERAALIRARQIIHAERTKKDK